MERFNANRALVYLFLAASLLALIDEFVRFSFFGDSTLSAFTPVRVILPLILAYGVSRENTIWYFFSVAVCGFVALSSFYGLIELSMWPSNGNGVLTLIVRDVAALLMSVAILVLLQLSEFEGPSL